MSFFVFVDMEDMRDTPFSEMCVEASLPMCFVIILTECSGFDKAIQEILPDFCFAFTGISDTIKGQVNRVS